MTLANRRRSLSVPRFRFFKIAHRIARRFEPEVRKAFVAAITKMEGQIDVVALEQAVSGGNLSQILYAVQTGGDLGTILGNSTIERTLRRAGTAMGEASAAVLTDVLGVEVSFSAFHPNVVLYARQQVGDLIVAVTDDVREAVRIIVARAQVEGLTVVQQARAIREVIGLPPNWANAPMNLGNELRAGTFTTTRRLSAVDKRQILSRLAKGTIDEPFIAKMQGRYRESLLNARALSIARTETARAVHHGLRAEWKDATQKGVLPKTARRNWIVTADDRLRETHAAIPGMNEGGVELDAAFDTPFGKIMDPPAEPLCRCSVGLSFPGFEGVL